MPCIAASLQRRFSHTMVVGPCTAAATSSLVLLLSLSGARLPHTWEQARSCRRAGYRYFATTRRVGEVEQILGLCLPLPCTDATHGDRRVAASAVLARSGSSSSDSDSVEPFTALSEAEDPRAARADAPAEAAGPDGAREKTAWFSVSLRELCAGVELPSAYYAAPFLAVTLAEFRGGSAEYIHAIWDSVSCFLQHGEALGRRLFSDDTTILVAGLYHRNYPINGGLRIRAVPGVAPCGADDWLATVAEASLGIEVRLPPMWRLLVQGAPAVTHRFLLPERQSLAWNGIEKLQVCSLSAAASLRWLVPQDALKAAAALAERSDCARAVASNLPELVSASAFFVGNASLRWADVEQKAMRCIERLEGSFWEVRVDAQDWPAVLHGASSSAALCQRTRRNWAGRSGRAGMASVGQLNAFVCLPSRFMLEHHLQEIGCVPPCAECVGAAIADVLPLMLAYDSGRYEELSRAPPPTNIEPKFGDRASSVYRLQLAAYHARAVEQRAHERRLGSQPATTGDITAAVCIIGLPRTLNEVSASIAANATGIDALGAETSIFFILDIGGRPLSDFSEALERLPPTAVALVNGSNWGEPQPCEAWERCGPACSLQFHKLGLCLRLAEAAEAARGRRFDWLLRLRPDTAFAAPVGDLADLDAEAVHAVFRESVGDLNDHFAIVPRAHAEAYFGIGASCPTEEEVRKSTCQGDLSGGQHTYPECALKLRLQGLGVKIMPFPQLFRVIRVAACEQTHGLWRGITKTEICGNTGN